MGKTILFSKATPAELIQLLPVEKPVPEQTDERMRLVLQFIAWTPESVLYNSVLEGEFTAKQLEKQPTKVRAVARLLALGQEAVPVLIQGLQDPSWYRRTLCAQVLGQIGGEQAVEALLAALKAEPCGLVDRGLIDGLAATRDPRALTVLLNCLELPLFFETMPERAHPVMRLLGETALCYLDRSAFGVGMVAVHLLEDFTDPRILPALEAFHARLLAFHTDADQTTPELLKDVVARAIAKRRESA